jgi:hypothetical protein
MSSIDTLTSLPYLTWAPAEKTIDKRGVVKYDRTKAFPGLNMYSEPSSKCYIVDMSGNVLHKWWGEELGWQIDKLCKNGDLIVVLQDKALCVLDWNSHIKWIKRMSFHHDVALAANGDIYAIVSKNEWVLKSGIPFSVPFPAINDYIVVLSPKGAIKREISLLSLLKNEISFRRFFGIYPWMVKPGNLIKRFLWMIIRAKNIKDINNPKNYAPKPPLEIFHTNTIEIIDRDIPGLCNKGDLLVCMAHLSLVAILDIKKEKVIWMWGQKELQGPHDPLFLKNGNILIFDNGIRRKYSRVIELNPLTKEIVWEYRGEPREDFFSWSRGANQRLPNGNTLITESERGRAFEVTPGGEIAWEFYEPYINTEKMRVTINRMIRIINPEDYPCLKNMRPQ